MIHNILSAKLIHILKVDLYLNYSQNILQNLNKR